MTAATTPATPTSRAAGTTPVPRWSLLRLLRVEVRDELLNILREPTALFFSIAMPVGFFAMFAGLWGGNDGGAGISVGTRMLATFGTFGVVGVTLLNPGIGVADDRERGWLRHKKVTATPLPVTLVAKVLATIPYSLGVLLAMTGVAAALGVLDLGLMDWLRLAGVLAAAAWPFALLALAVGFLATPNATTAILQALYIPSAVASGLWMPLEDLPTFIGERLAPILPTYHLAQLGLAQIGVADAAGHVLPLAAFGVLAALAAGVAYRAAKP